MTTALCADIKDLNRSGGIVPINIGSAKLEETEHILTHYYELNELYKEVDFLNSNYSLLSIKVNSSRKLYDKIYDRCKFYEYVQDLVALKISNIQHHGGIRHKRGLINGLGTVIKAITGNLDNDDRERYDKILEELDGRNRATQTKLSKQYSIVNQLITNYNETLQTIQFNNEQIKTKITEIEKIINPFDGQLILYKEVLYLLQSAIHLILNVLSEIETSITFCKLGALHPSIISTHVLELELSKININISDILSYESLIKVQCNIRSERIVYFLTIPVYKAANYNLYYLYSVPWPVDDSYTTVVPKHRYLLKQDERNEIIQLSDRCIYNEIFYCNTELISYSNADCEKIILTNGSTNSCPFTKLQVTQNYVSIIPETNYLISVFPTEDQIQIESNNHKETLLLKGIHIIKPIKESVYYRNSIISTQMTTFGKPSLLSVPPPQLSTLNVTHMTLKFEDINLRKLDPFHLNLNPTDPNLENTLWYPSISPSVWTLVLYVTLIALFSYTYINYRRANRQAPCPS